MPVCTSNFPFTQEVTRIEKRMLEMGRSSQRDARPKTKPTSSWTRSDVGGSVNCETVFFPASLATKPMLNHGFDDILGSENTQRGRENTS